MNVFLWVLGLAGALTILLVAVWWVYFTLLALAAIGCWVYDRHNRREAERGL